MTQRALHDVRDEHPGLRQSLAADPLMHRWVGASAGTGKTKVLIDRLLRLMLPRPGMGPSTATFPEKILCLTFTKTGAAEMSGRIRAALAGWSVMEDAALDKVLLNLTGAAPDAVMRGAARRLFARVLDAPGGLRIMTIHAFCQSVLKRFPIEAGLPPHFELMDEQSAVEYLTRCLHDIVAEARRDKSTPLARAFDTLALHLDAAGMSDLMSKIMSERGLFGEILRHNGGVESVIRAVYSGLHAEDGETEDGLIAAACEIDDLQEAELKKVLGALIKGGKKDADKAAAIQPWLEQKARRAELLAPYRRAFLTADGAPYKTFAYKDATAAYPDIGRVMGEEADRLMEIDARLQALRLAQINAALLIVAAEMTGRYEQHKRNTDRLDFDDLVIRTCALLESEGMAPWVLYKLDGGIDHILVDEAQDTSPLQWRVIQALSEEFFAGAGARDATRTLFVVGDEKQSIFSFQGADPSAFARMQDFFGQKAKLMQDGWEVFLEYSFRSTRTVLEVVDGVFAHETARRGVVFDAARAVRHLPFRAGHAGEVEIWPLAAAAEAEEPEAWAAPTAIEPADNAAAALADRIAATIRGWLDNKEHLRSKNRPLRAGDVLILVQSRGTIVELLMRALKDAKIPVAGIDRMTLTQEISVMDLIAAAQFALQPRDDLTLATVLKSPLFNVSEEELYGLCRDRKASLWQAVQEKRPDFSRFLAMWVEWIGRATPYEFFAELLATPCAADAISARRAFYARLGHDIHDALDEFLNAALHFEQSHTPSVQKFVDWFLRGETEIKREQEQHKEDQVRIMTVHGAKGLQAPVVFLPDTVKKLHDHNQGRIRLLWPDDEKGVPLWSPRQDFDAPAYAALAAAAREKQEEEYRRLLYVALTRAEDRLYVCGWRGRREPKDDCWYNLVKAAFPAAAEKMEGDILRIAHPQEAPPEADKQAGAAAAEEAVRRPLPDFALRLPPEEEVPSIPLAPSRPGEDEPAVKGPLADQSARFRRGVISHQLLEFLPDLPADERAPAMQAFLSARVPQDAVAAFSAEIMAVLNHPEFAPIFGPGSRAEVPVVGIAGKVYIVSGQIDRLVVTDKEVLVVDYKTNRPPPHDAADVPALYLKQMAAYRAVLARIYPEHKVKCALLWTDGPFLMPLPNAALDSYAP